MKQYIPKDALVAEIERWLGEIDRGFPNDHNLGRFDAYKRMLSLINTLEVKEVDLEEALSDLDKDIKEFVTTEEFENEATTAGHYWVIAKHAFLLGLKAQKGEDV